MVHGKPFASTVMYWMKTDSPITIYPSRWSGRDWLFILSGQEEEENAIEKHNRIAEQNEHRQEREED